MNGEKINCTNQDTELVNKCIDASSACFEENMYTYIGIGTEGEGDPRISPHLLKPLPQTKWEKQMRIKEGTNFSVLSMDLLCKVFQL